MHDCRSRIAVGKQTRLWKNYPLEEPVDHVWGFFPHELLLTVLMSTICSTQNAS